MHRVSALLLGLLVVLSMLPTAVAAAPASGASLTIDGSPFDPNGDGKREQVRIAIDVAGPARVDVRIYDFDWRYVKTIARDAAVEGHREWTWKGRDGQGRKVGYGPYRVKATITTADRTVKRTRWLTRARRVPYPVRPDAIVVAIDPGHGGPVAGAVWRGLREDDVNLDISLRLEAMLKGAGIGVVMTRRTDRNVSPVGKDLNGDGRYTRLDELLARNDIANEARADIHLAVHNNASTCHCVRGTEMYTHDGRTWSPEGKALAKYLLDAHLWHLDRQPGYTPRNRGVKYYDFKALKPYRPVYMPRPSLQPTVLGESLFIDRSGENRILGRRSGRAAVAAAYFDGIARYLAWRPYGLRYEVLDAPRKVKAGANASVKVRLTNRGQRKSSGWSLTARVAPKVFRYDGRPKNGDFVAEVPIPDGLTPGQSIDVTLPGIAMPGKAGAWLVKLDVKVPGSRMWKRGVVGPQLRVDTVAP
jgi:N-acetylmuramoyl-L-alanine amidase